MARLDAEGQAADSERRLQVAQEQVAEFAHQREEEATNLMMQMQAALAGLHPESNPATLALFQVSGMLEQKGMAEFACASNMEAIKMTLSHWHTGTLLDTPHPPSMYACMSRNATGG